MRRRWWVILTIAAGLLLITAPVAADEPLPEDGLALARRYVPVLYFHPEEIFRPQPVDVIVEQARLRRSRRLWFDTNVLLTIDPPDLFHVEGGRDHFLDVWYGNQGGSAYTNYSAHRALYQASLSPAAGGPPVTVYARVARDELGRVTLQYWALYFYNDWFNKHEGDWEMIQVMLQPDGQPRWVVLSQHHGGTRRAWSQAPVEGGTHPAVYVALGSHANYFVGDEVYPNSQEIGDRRITIVDRTGVAERVVPEVLLLPERDQLARAPHDWPRAMWLHFRGHWGEMAGQSDFSGPLGPADKGEQWERPYAWGMEQPPDTETWYAHRLRVEVLGVASDDAHIQLTDRHGSPLSSAEVLGNLVVLHRDPPPEALVATIEVPQTVADLVATWPDRRQGRVTRYRFADVDFSETGLARLELGSHGAVKLLQRCLPGESGVTPACLSSRGPSEATTVEATWDAKDVVWIGGVLPAHQVGVGLLLAVLASIVPTGLYVGSLYWLDRYEKEPSLLVMAAFLWGSIPALALALAAEVFFRLPPDLIGAQALEVARSDLTTPLLQEGLKGIAVLFIALCYWREFDNLLDGIIYGATVGFGFAMTRNLIDHVSAFALWGFKGLTVGLFVEGVLYALGHAFYTAVFGVALGLARLARAQWQRWAWPCAGFALAVGAHALHNMLIWDLMGVNAVTVATTGAGVVLIGLVAGWSLRRQHRALRVALKDELPASFYHTLLTPGGRARARWRSLRAGGLAAWQRRRRLHDRCAELAFKKMQRRRRPDAPGLDEEIERLRTEVDALMSSS